MSSKSRWRKATLRKQRAAFKAVAGPLFSAYSPLEGVTADTVIRSCKDLHEKLGNSLLVKCAAEVFMSDGSEYGNLRFAPRMTLPVYRILT